MAPNAEPAAAPVVLVVEDDEDVRGLLLDGLPGYGFTVLAARGGEQALELLRRHPGEVGVALLDVRMPRLSGPQTLEALRELEPGLPACLMSGYADAAEEYLVGLCDHLFHKPFVLDEVASVLRRLSR